MERLKLRKKKKHQHPKIIPELAELGVYAQSVKPKEDWLTQREYHIVFLCQVLQNMGLTFFAVMPDAYFPCSNTEGSSPSLHQYIRIGNEQHHP